MPWGFPIIMRNNIIFAVLLISMLLSCSQPMNYVYLMPAENPYAKAGNDFLSYNNGIINIELESVRGMEKSEIGRTLRYSDIESFMKDYHVIRMKAQKLVDTKVSVNFDNIVLIISQYNQKQPLNYFDLLMIAEKNNDKKMREFIRSYIKKGRVLLEKDMPAEACLVFSKISPNDQRAVLTLNDIYSDSESFKAEIFFSINVSRDSDIKERLGF